MAAPDGRAFARLALLELLAARALLMSAQLWRQTALAHPDAERVALSRAQRCERSAVSLFSLARIYAAQAARAARRSS